MKMRSLGTAAGAARGIVISAISVATPMVATLTAGHRQRDGNRIGVAGCTLGLECNGDFTLDTVAGTTANLLGTVGVTTQGGTIITAALCDKSPFLPRHSAVAFYGDLGGASAIFAGTVVFEGADRLDPASAGLFYYDSATGVDTSGFKSVLKTGEIAIPAQSMGGGSLAIEVDLCRYMSFRISAHVTGGAWGALFSH